MKKCNSELHNQNEKSKQLKKNHKEKHREKKRKHKQETSNRNQKKDSQTDRESASIGTRDMVKSFRNIHLRNWLKEQKTIKQETEKNYPSQNPMCIWTDLMIILGLQPKQITLEVWMKSTRDMPIEPNEK